MGESRSYADLVTGAVFLRIGGADEATADLIATARQDPRPDTYKQAVLSFAWRRYRSLLVHEWAHVLQVASYPYLFLRAARQGRMMSGVSRFLKDHPQEYPLPLPLQLSREWAESHLLSEFPVQVVFGEEGVSLSAVRDPDSIVRGAVTELDLVEEDAQIFQYRAEIGSRGNGAAYRRWRSDRPCYTRLFQLVSRHIGVDPAYRTLPLLVRLAFRTTRPLHAFFKALGMVYANGSEALSDWQMHDVLEKILLEDLQDLFGPAKAEDLIVARPEIADPEGVIDDETFARIMESGLHLPVSPLARLHLHGDGDGRGAITEFLREPWRFLPRRADPTDVAMTFLPAGMLVRLAGAEFPTGASVLSISPLLARTPFEAIPGTTYADWFVEVLRGRLVWKAIADGARGPNPLCPHTGCRFHGTGLCHGWFPVPRQAQDCQFPSFFQLTTSHDVASDGSRLVPHDGEPVAG